MKKGRLDDIDDEGDDASIEVSASQPSHVIYEKEEKIKIDYRCLILILSYLFTDYTKQTHILFFLN